MKDASRPLSLGLFLLTLICFLLPFARISCEGEKGKDEVVVQGTGYEVAFGKTIPARPDTTANSASPPAEKTGPDFVAVAILAATLVGIGLVKVKGRRGAVVRGIYSGHCLLLPLALWVELQFRVGFGGNVEVLIGWWATLGLFAAACVVNLAAISRLPRAALPAAGTG